MNEDMGKLCLTCKWYAEYEGVCTNGESKNCADFTAPNNYCGLWEGADELGEGGKMEEVKKCCYNCKWCEAKQEICWNDNSEKCAEWVEPDFLCEEWEEDK